MTNAAHLIMLTTKHYIQSVARRKLTKYALNVSVMEIIAQPESINKDVLNSREIQLYVHSTVLCPHEAICV